MRAPTLFLALVICFAFVTNVKAHPVQYCDLTVVGQNNPLSDPLNVLDAVNAPHSSTKVTLCLEGLFDFGPTGFVSIQPSNLEELNIVVIDDADRNKATIRRGRQPFTFGPATPLARLIISNLRFDKPVYSAITILTGNELIEISKIDIDGVDPILVLLDPAPAIGLHPFKVRKGIVLSNEFSNIGGRVSIFDNKIDGGAYDYAKSNDSINRGIDVGGAVRAAHQYKFNFTADVPIRDNIIRNWSGSGIFSQEPALIENNLIETGTFANSFDAILSDPRICVASGITLWFSTDVRVERNTINMAPSTRADGSTVSCAVGLLLQGNANQQSVPREQNCRHRLQCDTPR